MHFGRDGISSHRLHRGTRCAGAQRRTTLSEVIAIAASIAKREVFMNIIEKAWNGRRPFEYEYKQVLSAYGIL